MGLWGLEAAARAALQCAAPETAHRLAIAALRAGLVPAPPIVRDSRLAVDAFGRTLPHPLGLAAGFDKNAEALGGLARLGFAFIEAGTITPRPQAGNPRPRLFRLAEDHALINRMGFNNDGIARVAARLARADRSSTAIGANLGINKDRAEPRADYPALVRAVRDRCDYLVINVSSPNTPGLRDLQSVDRLAAILAAIAREAAPHPPLFVKLAPDLADDTLPDLARLAIERGLAGLIVSNTTIARPATLRGAHRGEAGGLSGQPLFAPSTRMLARLRLLAGDRLMLIGAGGVASGAQALAKIRAGATLVQVYTGFVEKGSSIIPEILTTLARALDHSGEPSITRLIGRDAERLAETTP